MTPALLSEVAEVVRRLSAGLAVEVAAILPVMDGILRAPILLAAGTPASVCVTPSTVFATAVRLGVSALVLVHTHLADTPPSEVDRAVTRRLTAAGLIVGVPLVSHLVVGPRRAWDCTTSEVVPTALEGSSPQEY